MAYTMYRAKSVVFLPLILTAGLLLQSCQQAESTKRPNFLILMSDNHSWNHLGCYGDEVLQTPNIDKLAAEGVRFTNAFCSSPSCTPARASMLTGQEIWRLEEGANLWGAFPAKFPVYTDALEEAGYLVGFEGKGWGPGNYEAGGRSRNPAGDKYDSFEEFYNERERGQPFCYWFSSRDPHRPYRKDGGKKAGIDASAVAVPDYLPDNADVREDMTDYYAEIQGFDRDVGAYLQLLGEMGEVDNTVIIVASDNGWQMPRGLANLYDAGTRIPLIITKPDRFPGGRVVDDFVSLTDFAPTLLELAGLPGLPDMTAKSLVGILESEQDGVVEPERDFIVTARERHAFVRQGGAGYPGRAIRTNEYLYIRNYEPERWPAGDPPLFGDVDAHMMQYPSLTKMYMLKHRDEDGVKALFDLAFEKRPAEELYDLVEDPDQMRNVAGDPAHQEAKARLAERLSAYLAETGDPREVGGEMKWEDAEYFAEKDKRPQPSEDSIEELGLEEEYSYVE
jgi:N-sulfoglucosamine sulfohydrolase